MDLTVKYFPDRIHEIIVFISEHENDITLDNYNYVFNELKLQLTCTIQKDYIDAVTKYALKHIDIEEKIHGYLFNCMKALYDKPNFNFTLDKQFLETFFRFSAEFGGKYKNKNINKYFDIYLLMNNKLNFEVVKILFHIIVTKYEYLNLVEFNNQIIKFLKMTENDWCSNITNIYKSKDVYNIIKYLYDKNLLDNMILTQMIYYSGIENIYDFLNNIGFVFQESHLKTACYCCNIKSINLVLNQKIKYDEKIVEQLFSGYYGNNIKECINLFMQFGYRPTKEVLIIMIDRKISPNENMIKKEYLEDKDFMSKVEVILHKNNMFPNNFNINPNNKTLVALISNSAKLSDIKKLIKDNKLKPDIECLREACKHKANKATIKYLVETHKLQPDDICMQNSINLIHNPQLSYVFDLYKK